MSAANDPLARASAYVMQASTLDNHLPDMSHLMGCNTFNELTVNDFESSNYPGLEFKTAELSALKIKLIPAELQERMKELQCSCQMGVFADIHRAWLSIDNEIYLWAFGDSNDIAFYDGLNEVILTAALVKPKPNIFQCHINYLLCLATPIELVLLGITFSSRQVSNEGLEGGDELHILPEPLFTISVDNVAITTIRGTSGGRIFLGGKDGRLYEVDYQGDYGWFGKRSIWKTNHSISLSSYLVPKFVSSYISPEDPVVQVCIDESRHVLYTRSLNSNIELFYLGKDGTRTSKIAYTCHSHNVKKIVNSLKSYEVSKFSTIKHMCCIPSPDSDRVHLMAITQTGVRLYYTTKMLTETAHRPTSPPDTLSLIHIRLPPAFFSYQTNFSSPPFVFERINHIHFCQGTSLMTGSNEVQEGGDVLWVFSTDLFPSSTHISESYEATQLAGQVWAFEEISSTPPHESPLTVNDVINDDEAPLKAYEVPWTRDIPSPVTQIYSANKKFAIVTSMGVCVAVKLTLVDRLHHLLRAHGVESDQVHAYFKTLQDQALVNCLNLMISNNLSHQQMSSHALKAYHLYKWNSPNHLPHLDHQTSTPMHLQARRQLGAYPEPSVDGAWSTHDLTLTSCNHRALYLFTSRLLRPVWLKPIVTPVLHKSSKTTFLASRLKPEQVLCVLQKVASFKNLLLTNPSLLSPTSLPHPPNFHRGLTSIASPIQQSPHSPFPRDHSIVSKRNTSMKEAAEMDEASSLRHLEMLLDASAQLLNLWRLLSDHQFHVVSSKLPVEKQQRLVGSTFGELVLEDQDISKSLVSSLLELYIEDHAAIDVVSARLEEHCPLLYTSLDQALNKGNEYINVAKNASNPVEKDRLIDLAVKHYRIICSAPQSPQTPRTISPIDLSSMCSKLASVSAYKGIVELVVIAAVSRDPTHLALHFYLNSKPIDDIVGESHYRMRLDCYKCILESLSHLLSMSESAPNEHRDVVGFGDKISNMLPSIFCTNQKAGPANGGLSSCREEACVQMNRVMETVVQCEDRLCQFVLFRWMVDNNLMEKMLELQSMHIEEFLKLESSINDTQHQPQHMQQYSHQQQQLLYQKSMLQVLASYYMKQSKFVQAAKILDSLALTHGNHIDLTERLNFMTRASLCLQSSTTVSAEHGGGHFLHEVQDKVEVIMLQQEVLREVEKVGNDCHQAIIMLNSQLYDVSELYSLFATPYDLSKCKLSIIRCCGHLDAALVESLWEEVLNKELSECAGEEVGRKMERFASFVVSLGKDHHDSENYFPIDFLVRKLEQTSVLEGFPHVDVSCMSGAMLQVGLDVISLHDVYATLYNEKKSFWRNHGRPFHLMDVDARLMASFIDQQLDAPSNNHLSPDKRRAVGKLLRSISSYLVDLQSEVDQQTSLVASLKQMRVSLERLQSPGLGF